MKLISLATDCTIETYIASRFDNRLERLIIEGPATNEELLQALNDIETEFNDLCGNFPDELKKANTINKLIARNMAVEKYFTAIEMGLEHLNAPYLDVLPKLKKMGVNIKWNNDIDDFRSQFKKEKVRENLKHVQLKELQAELKAGNLPGTDTPQFTKKIFHRLINSVSALGFKVSKRETDMYSFGVMCFDYYEILKSQSTN